MKVRLQSYPNLGSVTRVNSRTQAVTVVLEVPHYFGKEPWEVAAWHSTDESEWGLLDLKSLSADGQPVDLQTKSADLSRLAFHGSFSYKSSVQFTVKFRHGSDEPWVWVRDEYGLGDGYIVLDHAPSTMGVSDIADLIPNLNSEWTVSSLSSQTPETRLWSLEAGISASKDDVSARKDLAIGTPFGTFHKWIAFVRSSAPWLAPRKGTSELSLDKDAMICSFENKKGQNLLFLAVSAVEDVQSLFRSSGPQCISVHARNDAITPRKIMILVSEGVDFDRALASVVYHARSLIWRTASLKSELTPHKDAESTLGQSQLPQTENDAGRVDAQWRESWYDGLGYCTWNSLGQQLTEKKILDALSKLEESKIKISNLIIDDNWQSIDTSGKGSSGHAAPGWLEFEANKDGFPGGLRQTVSKIRLQHRNIEQVGVWHALLGYWGGISPRGTIAKTYKTTDSLIDSGDRMTVIAKDDLAKFYDDFYSFLTRSGITMVKTDAQSLLDSFEDASARRELTNTYLDTWALAALRNFGINAISCMSQYPQPIFHAHMPQIRPPVVMRNSDDYFPDVPSSHRWHVWTNAHNAMLTQYLNVIPDWDMFQTVHEYAHYHAAARCVSGGPIYITDVPGKHDMSLVDEMTAITPRGKTIVLRPSVIGKALDPYLDYDADALLQVGGYHGEYTSRVMPPLMLTRNLGGAQTGTSMISVFQTSDARNFELIPLAKFPGVGQSGQYVVRAYSTGQVAQVPHTDTVKSILLASAGEHGYEIYSVNYLPIFSGRVYGKIGVANLGLLNKMAGCAAVVSSSIKLLDNGRIKLTTKLKGLGVHGTYISTLPHMTIDGDFMVTILDAVVPRHTVKLSEQDSRVLEVDVLAAWNEMGLDSGWSNEVEVKISFNA